MRRPPLTRRRVLLPAAGLLLLAGLVAPGARAGTAPAEQARTADSVVDSIGVNTHLGYAGSAYQTHFADAVKPRLVAAGIRHVRDVAYTGSDYGAYYSRLRELGAAGVDFNLLTSAQTQYSAATDLSRLGDVQRSSGGAVRAFEGTNEMDLIGGPDWVARTRDAQRRLAAAVRGDGALAGVRVLAPTVTTIEAAMALGDLTPSLDIGNVHHYVGGRQPETPGYGDDDYGTSDWILRRMARPVSGSRPVWSTESGYVQDPVYSAGIAPDVAAAYVPRVFLEHLASGISRTYDYELLDGYAGTGDREDAFGLLKTDGTPKPSYTALSNLIGQLADPGPGFAPGTLGYQLTGDTSNVRHLLVQKRTGEFSLLLWTDGQSWQPDQRYRLPGITRSVGVQLPTGLASGAVTRFDGAGRTTTSPLAPGTTNVPVTAGEYLTVVRLSPSDSTAASASTAGPITDFAGKCLDAAGARSDPGTLVLSWSCHDGTNQRWTVAGSTVTGLDGSCLDVNGGSTADGARVQLWPCNGSPAQRWTVSGGRLLTPAGKCLDVAGASTADGARLITWTCHGGPNQQFGLPG